MPIKSFPVSSAQKIPLHNRGFLDRTTVAVSVSLSSLPIVYSPDSNDILQTVMKCLNEDINDELSAVNLSKRYLEYCWCIGKEEAG